MTLMVNGKKVVGYAIGENEYLSGENLNTFYIDTTQYDSNVDSIGTPHRNIDMTNYFKEADRKHPDVLHNQILIILDYIDNNGTSFRVALITPLLKRGEINNKRSVAANNNQATTAWFKDKNTLAISTKSMYEDGTYHLTGWFANVYGFTSQDVGIDL